MLNDDNISLKNKIIAIKGNVRDEPLFNTSNLLVSILVVSSHTTLYIA